MIIYYFLLAIVIYINTLFAATNHPKRILVYSLIILLIILFGGNTLNPDYQSYIMNYMWATGDTSVWNVKFSEVGYTLLVNLFAKTGLSYNIFLFFIATIGIILINKTVKLYISNTNAFYIFYAFYPFLLDIVQIRNFIILSILVYSIRYLTENIKYGKSKFVILIFIASLFQMTALVYLPLVLIKNKKQRYLIRIMVIFSIVFSLISIIDSSIITSLMNVTTDILPDKRVATWFERSTRFGFLYNWTLQFINLIIIRMIYFSSSQRNKPQMSVGSQNININEQYSFNFKKKLISKNSILQQKTQSTLLEVIYWINVYATIFLPFYIMASVFDRLMRNLMLINYIAIIYWGEKSISSKKQKTIIIFFYCVYVIFLFVMNILVSNPNVANQIFHNNMFFK
jgi:hypothetical protein